MARRCLYCRAVCHGACPGAKAAHERFAARERAKLETNPESERVRVALAALTPQEREDLFR